MWATAYLKYQFTPEFYAAILNSQPMGFYSASTLVEDAKRHHVVVRGPTRIGRVSPRFGS